MEEKIIIMLKLKSFESVISVYEKTKNYLSSYLNALEYLDQESFYMVNKMNK